MAEVRFAVARTEAIEYVRFEGLERTLKYPNWFIRLVHTNQIYKDPDHGYIYANGKDIVFVREGDCFMVNYKGEVMVVDQRIFNDYFYEVR